MSKFRLSVAPGLCLVALVFCLWGVAWGYWISARPGNQLERAYVNVTFRGSASIVIGGIAVLISIRLARGKG